MSRRTILIQSEFLGRGSDELGELLMSRFLTVLVDSKVKPASLLFLNSGVKLAVEGSWALTHLRKLEEQGVAILACGTCLDFFELTDKLKVGKPTNMADTVDSLLNSDIICL
jgi:selenium metabolism protein YedF